MINFADWLSYDAVTGALTWRVRAGRCAAGAVAGTMNGRGYRQVRLSGRIYLAHRVAWHLHYGVAPQGDVDHVNGDKSDNRVSNLRLATRPQNIANAKRRYNTQTRKGVSKHKNGRFKARLVASGVEKHLGYFDTEEQAHAAYIAAAQQEFGPFARAE